MSAVKITKVSTAIYELPLPVPIRLGHFDVTSREYVALQIHTNTGLIGSSWALSRGAPIDRFIDRFMAPILLGRDPSDITRIWTLARQSMTPVVHDGSGMRALSLVDIALWDIKGQSAGVPIWELLGGYRDRTDVLMIAGYLRHDEDPARVSDEVSRFSRLGHSLVKIACAESDDDTTRMLAGSVASGLDNEAQLVIDAAWRWQSAREAVGIASKWADSAPVAWLEDPFRVSRARQFDLLHRSVPRLRIGAGDEASDTDGLTMLVDAGSIDVLRLDLTTIGGYTGAVPLVLRAQSSGTAVSPHVYPEMSIHLAMAFPSVSHIETFDRDVADGNPLDPAHLYVESELPAAGASYQAPRNPGLAARLDLQALRAFAR